MSSRFILYIAGLSLYATCRVFSLGNIVLPAAATPPDTTLSRAYAQPERFTPIPASEQIDQAPFHILQSRYSGVRVRPDDTMGEKLARILALSSTAPATPSIQILLLDEAGPAFNLNLLAHQSPDQTIRTVCAVIPVKMQVNNGWQERLREQVPACEHSLLVSSQVLAASPSRARFSDGSLNEIGHRMTAELVFSALVQSPPDFLTLTPPPLYRQRINIHPERNERLASID